VSPFSSKSVSRLLAQWHAGDDEALGAVLPLVYDELRRLAHHYMRQERPGHTLQSTALVHEAYLRLQGQGAAQFRNRAHFVAICAQLMRQILVQYARGHGAAKRDGGMRFFGGLSIEEVADVLALSPATVNRNWAMARIWLHHRLNVTTQA
jgi:DNA-directed RNA polymerase specialized sigma24 family protein